MIRAGKWTTSEGIAVEVENDVLFVRLDDLQDDPDADSLSPMPNPDCEYATIEVIHAAPGGLKKKPRVEPKKTTNPPTPPVSTDVFVTVSGALTRSNRTMIPIENGDGLKLPLQVADPWTAVYPNVYFSRRTHDNAEVLEKEWRRQWQELATLLGAGFRTAQLREMFSAITYVLCITIFAPRTPMLKSEWWAFFYLTFEALAAICTAAHGTTVANKLKDRLQTAFVDNVLDIESTYRKVEEERNQVPPPQTATTTTPPGAQSELAQLRAELQELKEAMAPKKGKGGKGRGNPFRGGGHGSH
jgi:hypothetical protein